MKSRLILAFAAVCAVALAVGLAVAPSASQTQRASAAVHGLSQHGMSKSEKRHLSGFASFEAGIGVSAKTPRVRFGARPNTDAGVNLCPRNFGPDVLVNQNCLNITDSDLQGRGQAQNETAIAQDPTQPGEIVAGYNDYRRGDGTCGTSFSANAGSSFTDATMPNGFVRGDDVRRRGARVLPGEWRPVGGLGYARATCTTTARSSCAGLVRRTTRTSPAAVYVYRSTAAKRGVVELPRPSGRPAVHDQPCGAARQAVHDDRQPPRQPVPGPDLRDVDVVQGQRTAAIYGGGRMTTASRSAPRFS